MNLLLNSPQKALNKAFLKQRPVRSDIDLFKNNLLKLLGKIDEIEREENQKTHIRDFLRDTFYKESFEINTKDTKDLVIHLGKTSKDKVGVIIEAKRPSNKAEMFSKAKPNSKALQELILYYFDERIRAENNELKQLVITNVYEWYIFDANSFDKSIYRNVKIKKLYETFINDKKSTTFFYEEVSKLIPQIEGDVHCSYFDIREYQKSITKDDKLEDKNLISLLKILSPQHLLKLPFANDSNELDQNFYKELLHILGLEEIKNTIRLKEKDKNPASLLELTIKKLKTKGIHKIPDLQVYGEDAEEQHFNIALELCITWINRILFLKLLEGQLVNNHKGDNAYRFLSLNTIPDFNELFKLFHEVLAIDVKKRDSEIKIKYKLVPYLNSSLFDISEIEDLSICVDSLDNSEILEYYNSTILKDHKKNKDKLKTLDYLFQFLNSYDFSSEDSQNIQEDNKTLINASVLGKVFEKINGYKDGSIYTPGYITMYMCRQSLRLAVFQKFKDAKKEWKLKSFKDIYNKIDNRDEANKIINELKICDPAVGSGHFLVSALNEIIAIKSELKILQDKNGDRLKEYAIEIENDELFITDEDGKIFEYIPKNKESQRVQETLFLEKQNIIENCLFGVDINPNSVKICRLRLWIELLKNAYYKENTNYQELETLPNIDINIKCGNSLLNRYGVKDTIFERITNFKKKLKDYIFWVQEYKNTKDPVLKKQYLKNIKLFVDEFKKRNPKILVLQDLLNKKNSELHDKYFAQKLFSEEITPARLKEKQQIENKIIDLTEEIEELKQTDIYSSAFEWRLEFPEVLDLDKDGKFEGFDVIIGNPPYGVSITGQEREIIVESYNKVPDFEIYYFFINLSKRLLRPNGINSFIIPNTILFNVGAKKYRENLFSDWQINEILDCTNFNIFEGAATVRCIITSLINRTSNDTVQYRPTADAISFDELIDRKLVSTSRDALLANNKNWALVFKLNSNIINLVSKIRNHPPLLNYFLISQGYIPYRRSDLIKIYGKEEAAEIVDKRKWHADKKINEEYKQEIWGENLSKYKYAKANSFVWYGKHLAGYIDLKFFNQKRLLIREITNPGIIGCIVNEELVNDPQIISIIENERKVFPIEYLWVILNSKLATFYHFNSSPKATKGAFPKILVDDIKNFPIPSINPDYLPGIINLVNYLFLIQEEKNQLNEFVSNDHISKQFEELLDACVYELYFESDLKSKNALILELIPETFIPIVKLSSEEQRIKIAEAYQVLRNSKSEIRNRMTLQKLVEEISLINGNIL